MRRTVILIILAALLGVGWLSLNYLYEQKELSIREIYRLSHPAPPSGNPPPGPAAR
jgi:hypothetical protein